MEILKMSALNLDSWFIGLRNHDRLLTRFPLHFTTKILDEKKKNVMNFRYKILPPNYTWWIERWIIPPSLIYKMTET